MRIIKFALVALLIGPLVGCNSNKSNEYDTLTEEQIFNQGKANIDDGKYTQAVKDFDTLQSRYPYGKYAEDAQISLIYSYYKKSNYALAIASTNHFLELHPRHKHADYVTYMKGLSYYQQYFSTVYKYFPIDRSQRDQKFGLRSFNAFKDLLEKFPKSNYAQDSRQHMILLKNKMAEHELYIAEFYMRKKAYIAAINRADNVVTNYNGTPAVKEALVLLEKAYTTLGMNELAKDIRDTLEKNY